GDRYVVYPTSHLRDQFLLAAASAKHLLQQDERHHTALKLGPEVQKQAPPITAEYGGRQGSDQRGDCEDVQDFARRLVQGAPPRARTGDRNSPTFHHLPPSLCAHHTRERPGGKPALSGERNRAGMRVPALCAIRCVGASGG